MTEIQTTHAGKKRHGNTARALPLVGGLFLIFAASCGADDSGQKLGGGESVGVDTSTLATVAVACTNNGNCSAGQTCEDYDCDGQRHCASPGQGGTNNCCLAVSGASCQSGFTCCWSAGPGPGEGMCIPTGQACPGQPSSAPTPSPTPALTVSPSL